jgi:malate dehydrogenase
VVSLRTPTPAGEWFSVAVASSGQYGTPEGLQFGFPVASDSQGGWSVVEGLAHDEFATERIGATTEELLAERRDVEGLGLVG